MKPNSRLLHIDALKALAAQAIVLHHLAAYGPIAETVQTLWPLLIAALFDYGRMAVQIFLVLGGFLSARALAPQGRPLQEAALPLLLRRWLRLALPFMAAVGLTLLCSALVERWLPELVPASVSLPQLLSHALLLHGVLGYEALTVGAWYVAIDLQLFALLVGLLWIARRGPRALAPLLVLVLAVASLWVFNLDAELDNYAPYFFGAYGLGALVHWLNLGTRRRWGWGLLLVALVLGALVYEFRGRILLAAATALLLAWLQRRHQQGQPLLLPERLAELVAQAGTHSYALFLVHFPICLLVNALFERKGDADSAPLAVAAMALAWALSNLASLPFYRWIEAPAGRLRFFRKRVSTASA
ncbi:acyltransferase family protein [Roseateles violae]|uniref:Acyltransferase family protein n=1 Tax=Roseateles violae TaxID=3058042 RepID=A0ABT8DMY8_9BURK|nr:acyltransferase family protein [Pelomonas sp. PFR6]MDN3919492.1 acyltransferase family protein [Pelomonas sp. PFR6]